VEPGRAAALIAFLDSMRFTLRVEVRDETPNRSVVWFPRNADPVKSMLEVSSPPVVVVPARRGTFALIPRSELAESAAAWGEAAGVWAYEALRVAAAEPRIGFETDHRTIPHEVGWIGPAVHLQKGCYRGQETVARVHNLGRPPRRLVLLHLDGSTQAHLPAHGADVMLDGRAIGFIGTAVHHFELGPVALAVVKRNVPTDVDLMVGEVSASQEVVIEP
jgi:tRNA-modifying protein YgfZ